MKKSFTLFAALIMAAYIFAQSPAKISYQAVIRNGNNELVTNSTIGLQISILQGTADGTIVFSETHKPESNVNGLITIEIGYGAVVSGNISAIDWTNGPFFLKTEADPAGGTNYTISGTSQLLSVPYALHAETAGSVKGLSDSIANKAVLVKGNQLVAGEKTFTETIHPVNMEVNSFNTGNRYAYIDLLGDDTYTDYALRLIRENTGPNANSRLEHRGTGSLFVMANDSGALKFQTKGIIRMNINANGSIYTNDDVRHYKTLRIYDISGKTLFFRQDGTHSYINNMSNFLTLGTPKNGGLHITGEGGVTLRIGNASPVGTVVLNIDTLRNINMNNNQVINVKTPLNPNDAANKAYVDSKVGGSGHYIGELYGGGVVFFVDHTGEHGLIVCTEDINIHTPWSDVTNVLIDEGDQSYYNGAANTSAIINQAGHTKSAAKLCEDYVEGGFTDWYLPAIDELLKLNQARYEVNKALNTNSLDMLGQHCSSTEINSTSVYSFGFNDNQIHYLSKSQTNNYIRAIRAF